jgi:4-hydroxybenzoate polyprenyltransferase
MIVAAGLTGAMAGLQICAGAAMDAGPIYCIGALAGAGHVVWQAHTVQLDSPADCLRKFQSNTYMGALPMAGIVLDRLCAG